MAISKKLRDLGLHKSEISVYLFLLRNGRSTAINVSRGTKIARPNCYHVFRQLLSKGLIAEEYVKNKRTYVARDANAIITYSENRTRLAEKVSIDLTALIRKTAIKPQIEFIEGDDEFLVLLNSLRLQSKLVLFGANPKDPSVLAQFINDLRTNPGQTDFKIIEPRRQISCYFLLWQDALAIIPVSSQPFATVVYNQTIYDTISTLVNA
jgi:sugar-specific transcriptional regulator TrmB